MHEEYYRRKIIANLWDFAEHEGEEEAMSVAELADEMKVAYILDDPRDDEVLIRAQIRSARALVTTLSDDRDNLFVVVGARALSQRLENPALRIMSRAQNGPNVRKLYLAGADQVRVPALFGGYQMATAVLHPGISEFLDRTLIIEGGEHSIRFRDVIVKNHPLLVGKTVSMLKEQYELLVLGVKRDEKYVYTPGDEFQLVVGDIVFVLGPELEDEAENT